MGSSWRKSWSRPTEGAVLTDMAYYLLNEDYLPPVVIDASELKRRLENCYKEMRERFTALPSAEPCS